MKIGKKIEHLLKNSIAALLRAVLEQKPQEPKPPFRRILFLRFDALGDMILSFPVYRAARDALPQAEIDVLCSQKNMILLKDTDLVNTLLVTAKNPLDLLKLILNIRKRNYDLIINLVTRPSFTYGIVARLGGPKSVRIAGDQEQFAYFYNRNIELPPKSEIHMMKRKFLVCKDFLSTEISHTDSPWINYSDEVKQKSMKLYEKAISDLKLEAGNKRLAALNLSAGLNRREWPVERYVQFLKQEAYKYREKIDGWVVFTDPGKPDKTHKLVKQLSWNPKSNAQTSKGFSPQPAIIALPTQSDFRVIMEFLTHVAVLITPDTSIAHAASAMGTPVLVLTIGENATVWDPVGVPHKIVFSEDLYSLASLPVDKVADSFKSLMLRIINR